jgi:hypothetical protein
MKKIAFVSILTVTVLFAIVLVLSPGSAAGSKKSNPAGPGTELPDSVLKFVQKACMDCHSNDGSAMARGKVNFSVWSTYDADKQEKKSGVIVKELTKSSMPPKKWKANNPNNVPTQAEIDMVSRWADSLKK